jgi:hypothetical protein
MLPGEEETREHIRTEFAGAFANARDTLELEEQVLDALCEATNRLDDTSPGTIIIAALTKLLRQHLAVRLLCERGLTREAEIIARGMFEVVLVVLGLLAQDFELRCGAPERRPTVGLRAKLVLAKMAIDREKYARMVEKGTALVLSTTARQNADTWVKDAESALGPQWIEWVRKHKDYFGLRVGDLAKRLGLDEYYEVIYRIQSGALHASDLDEFIVSSDEESNGSHQELECRLLPDCESAPITLLLARQLVCVTLLEIDRHFGLELEERIKALSAAQDSA